MYEIVKSDYGITTIIRKNADGSITWIPADEGNADYQQYLVDTDGGLPLPKEAK